MDFNAGCACDQSWIAEFSLIMDKLNVEKKPNSGLDSSLNFSQFQSISSTVCYPNSINKAQLHHIIYFRFRKNKWWFVRKNEESAHWKRCEVELWVAKCKSPFMVLVKHQTLLRGFPNWDASRVWFETTSKAVFGAQFWCLWIVISIGISQNGRCVQIEITGCQAQNVLKASVNRSKTFDMVLHSVAMFLSRFLYRGK